jgi:hypothetical protein
MEYVRVVITHEVVVPVTKIGDTNEALPFEGGPTERHRAAVAHIRGRIEAMDWGGYSTLGKALNGFDPWNAVEIAVADRWSSPTTTERLRARRG